LHGSKKVSLFGNDCSVEASIDKLEGMSAHGDQDDLCRFLSCQDTSEVKKIFLVHGEYLTQQEFSAKLNRKGFQDIVMPGLHSEIEINADVMDSANGGIAA
jgi:metallo-beta-lactamase family protein